MNSSIISVSELLNSAKNLISAGFSAGYNFEEINAAKYFDELVMNTSSNPIFSGILILRKSGKNFTVVDGLQRLTTICLLLCALCESYKGTSENNEEAKNKILSRFLIYQIEQEGQEVQNEPKLKLGKPEQEIYEKILFSKELSEDEQNNNLVQTYQMFLKKIKEHKISGTNLFKLVSKIQFMTITTDKSEVSIRELYQSLNENKGKSQINLISDFIIQEDENSGIIWQKMVASLREPKYLLESFIVDFLTTRMDEEIPNKSALYNNFKNYYYKISKFQKMETIIADMYKYSQYYLKIVNADFENAEIKEQIIMLNENEGKDIYPYLMEVLDDVENSHIETSAFINILMMINLFIKSQRESSFSNININFASLSKELNKMLVLKDYVPEMIEEDKLTINVINNLATFEV